MFAVSVSISELVEIEMTIMGAHNGDGNNNLYITNQSSSAMAHKPNISFTNLDIIFFHQIFDFVRKLYLFVFHLDECFYIVYTQSNWLIFHDWNEWNEIEMSDWMIHGFSHQTKTIFIYIFNVGRAGKETTASVALRQQHSPFDILTRYMNELWRYGLFIYNQPAY